MSVSGSSTNVKVAVFGAGIAGLSAAHELTRLGYAVQVYEANPEPGGFFRSARLTENGSTPSEYSWHGMGPWYHNTFDLMQQIPFDEHGSMYDRALSRPIDFGVFPDKGKAQFYDKRWRSIPGMFRMTKGDLVKWTWVMLKTWTARRRTEMHYSTLNAAQQWGARLSTTCHHTWRACFGPWVGSDWTVASLHTVGQFFCKQLTSWPPHDHRADAEGPAWKHGAGDGWLLLRGPSSEYWFERWVRHLSAQGVEFFWRAALKRLELDGAAIVGAELEDGTAVRADHYILAADPFAAARIIEGSGALAQEREARLFRELIKDGPHTQVSFRIAFAEPINFPRERMAVVVADSEFNLTLFAQEQAWKREVDLGKAVQSLWTGTSCVGTVPGRLYGLPVMHCSREQFLEEVMEQLFSCESLDAMVREANGGRSLRSFAIVRTEVWHEWRFDRNGIQPRYPKWVTTTNTQWCMPNQTTSVPNFFLCGAHTRTAADVWSIEAAVESGRRAAKGIDERVTVLPQHKPLWLRVLSSLDDLCFQVGLPHILELLLVFMVVAMSVLVAVSLFGAAVEK